MTWKIKLLEDTSQITGTAFTASYDAETKTLTIEGLPSSYNEAKKTLTITDALSRYIPQVLALFTSGKLDNDTWKITLIT